MLRLDGALVDAGAVKPFVNTTSAAAVWPFRRNRRPAFFDMGDIWSGRANTSSGGNVTPDSALLQPPSGPASDCSQTPLANCGHPIRDDQLDLGGSGRVNTIGDHTHHVAAGADGSVRRDRLD
jgi:hypothetical protein